MSCRPGRHRHLNHVVRHNLAVLIWAYLFYKLSRPAPATPPALRAGAGGLGLAGSHQNIQRRNSSVFYPADLSGLSAICFLCDPKGQALVNEPHQTTMPAPWEAVISRMLPPAGTTWLNPAAFATCRFFRSISQQRLPLFASSTLIREMTESDSVVSSAMENLLISYEFAPRHLHT